MGGIRQFRGPLSLEFGAVNGWTFPREAHARPSPHRGRRDTRTCHLTAQNLPFALNSRAACRAGPGSDKSNPIG